MALVLALVLEASRAGQCRGSITPSRRLVVVSSETTATIIITSASISRLPRTQPAATLCEHNNHSFFTRHDWSPAKVFRVRLDWQRRRRQALGAGRIQPRASPRLCGRPGPSERALGARQVCNSRASKQFGSFEAPSPQLEAPSSKAPARSPQLEARRPKPGELGRPLSQSGWQAFGFGLASASD